MDDVITENEEHGAIAGRSKARWTHLATQSLLLAAAGPLLLVVATVGWSLSTEGENTFFAIVAGILILLAVLVNRFGIWAKAVGAVVGVLAALGLWWTAFGLFAPSSFFEFMAGLLLLPNVILGAIACIAAIVAERRGNRGTHAEGGERTAMRTAAVIIGVAAFVSAGLTTFARSSVGEAEAAAADATSVMKDFEFDPVSYSVAGGSTVLIRNDDPFVHTWTVDDLGIDVVLSPGGEKVVTIPPRPGTYILYCEPHGDPEEPGENDMNGTLVVT